MIRIVAVLLMAWEPLNFAVEALNVLPTLVYRGWLAAVELSAHALVAAVSASGGLGLWNATSSAHQLASVAVVLSAARTIQVTWWTALPSAIVPGSEPFIATIAIVIAAICLTILQVRR